MSGPGPTALALLVRPTWRDVWLGALVQWLIFAPLLSLLLALAAGAVNNPNGILYAVFSPIYSAPVGAVVTVALGVPLAKALSVLLGRSTAWVAHLVAFLGLGFILATVLIHLWMLVGGSLWDSALWWSSLQTFVPIASAAALSVGAGWAIAWRRATVRAGRTAGVPSGQELAETVA